jgi:hypothetical protein
MVLMPALFKNRPYSVGIFFAVNRFFRFKNKRTVRFGLAINELDVASNRASATQAALAGALAAPITAPKKSRPAAENIPALASTRSGGFFFNASGPGRQAMDG